MNIKHLLSYDNRNIVAELVVQDEEKQQLAGTSLDYNLNHVQLRTMFQKELEAAKSGSKSDTQPAPTQSSAEHKSAEAASTSVTQNIAAQTASSTRQNDNDDDDAATAEPNADDAVKAEHHDNDAVAAATAAAASELDNMRISSAAQAQSQHAVPASVQAAAVDMLQKQLKGGQPEQALLQIEAALK